MVLSIQVACFRARAFVCILFSSCAGVLAVDRLACMRQNILILLHSRRGSLDFWHAHCCRFEGSVSKAVTIRNHVPRRLAPCSPGNFSDGVWHGRGTLRLATGDVYRGNWHQSLRHGQGDQVGAAGQCMRVQSGLLGPQTSMFMLYVQRACASCMPVHFSVPSPVYARGRSGAATRDIRESSCTTRGAVTASCATKMAMSTPGAG